MTTFMRRLRALAQTFSLAILVSNALLIVSCPPFLLSPRLKVINNATNATPNNPQSLFSTTTKKPALGPSFAFQSDATLWLARAPELDLEDGTVVNVAEVLRSRITV
jgi:RAD51-like protein 3